MKIEEAQKIAATIPCACSDCGMNEPRATEMIMQYAAQERNKAIDECINCMKENPVGLDAIDEEIIERFEKLKV